MMLRVAVDFFWRRAKAADVQGLDSAELGALMPYWFDDRFKQEREAGTILGVEDTGELIHVLFVHGAGGGPDVEAARIPVQGAPGLEEDMIGVLTPEQVQVAAAFLSHAPIEDWVQQYRDHLANAVRDWGFRRPFDDEWASTLLEDARDLAVLFERAASNGEAMIVAVVA
jgi:Domain of unknown function (DUF1877)